MKARRSRKRRDREKRRKRHRQELVSGATRAKEQGRTRKEKTGRKAARQKEKRKAGVQNARTPHPKKEKWKKEPSGQADRLRERGAQDGHEQYMNNGQPEEKSLDVDTKQCQQWNEGKQQAQEEPRVRRRSRSRQKTAWKQQENHAQELPRTKTKEASELPRGTAANHTSCGVERITAPAMRHKCVNDTDHVA